MDPALASFGLLHGTLTGGTDGKEKSDETLYLRADGSVSEKQCPAQGAGGPSSVSQACLSH